MNAMAAIGSVLAFAPLARAEGLAWAPEVRRGIDDLIAAVGRDSPSYDPANRPYVVFDFDNTTCIFDIQYQTYIYQLETMRFALEPDGLRTALLKDVAPAPSSVKVAMIEDAMDAYGNLLQKYGPFSPAGVSAGTQATLTNDVQWLEFASKMRLLANNYGELPESWAVRWFSGMTSAEVYSVASNSCAKYAACETYRRTLSGPSEVESRCGPVTNSFVNGLRVTPETRWLYRTLNENGIDVWICSASEINHVRAAVDHFGLHDDVTGVIAKTMKFGADARMLPECDSETGCGYFAETNGVWRRGSLATRSNCHGVGKVKAIVSAIMPLYGGRCPVAGFMDSTGDFNFCTEFRDMRLVVCINRANGGTDDGGGLVAEVAMYERDTLGYDLAKANAAGDTLYLLQGRDENGMRGFVATNATLRFGETTYRLFKGEENEAQLQAMIDGAMSVADAFNTFARGFLARYAGYHSIAPSLELGTAAQRYPWNGIVDICYRTAYLPSGKGVIEVWIGAENVTNLVLADSGTTTNAVAVDFRALAPERAGQVTFRATVK